MLVTSISRDPETSYVVTKIAMSPHMVTEFSNDIIERAVDQVANIIADDIMERLAKPTLDLLTPEVIKELTLTKVSERLTIIIADRLLGGVSTNERKS